MESDPARMPSFTLIGAMKCATTTLYFDLALSDEIYFSTEKKETSLLLRHPTVEGCKSIYKDTFSDAPRGKLIGEVSTMYTKMPLAPPNLAEKALSILGPDQILIYLVRHPYHRIMSHYYHNVRSGVESRPLNDAIQAEPHYTRVSDYEYQIRPWADCFGTDNILVIPYESYITDRAMWIERISESLGIRSFSHRINSEVAHNRRNSRRHLGGRWRAISRSRLYNSSIRRAVPPQWRARVADVVSNKQETFSPETIEILDSSLLSSTRRFEHDWFGQQVWSFD
jgi:hypothetical protein